MKLFSIWLQEYLGLRMNIFLHNPKTYNFLDWDWFKKLLFSTTSLAQVVIEQFVFGQCSEQIIFTILV